MMRAWVFLLLVAAPVAVGAEEAFPVSGASSRAAPATVFEDRAALRAPEARLRVAAYNIENFTDGDRDGDDRTSTLVSNQARLAAANLAEIDADLVFIIEIENGAALRILNEALPTPYPAGYITRLGDTTQDEQKLNLAALSRVPLAGLTEIDFGPLQGAGRPTRGLLRADVDLGDGHRLAAYLVHLKSNYGYKPRNMYKRRHALQEVMSDVKSLRAAQPAVTWEFMVIGDMNVDPENPEFAGDWSLSPLRKDFKDLWRGRPIHERMTLATRYGDPALEFPPVCFDRIYAGGDLTNFPWRTAEPQVLQKGTHTRNVKVLPGQEDHVSDHYPIYVDVERAGRPAP
jgi:endonuclease/exonuclease/phosphatase family metal-dependent hydrolase